MAAARWLLALMVLVGAGAPAAAAPAAGTAAEIRAIAEQLRSDDRVTRAYGAIAARHFARRQWGFNLLDRPELQHWQRALAPSVPALVELLADDGGMEWVDENGNPEQVTTPRREATQALLALERPSVAPLIAALDRRDLANKADQLLRQLTRGGPPEATRAAWQHWWAQHEGRALPNERGQLWLLLLGAAVLGLGAALVVWRQRRARERKSDLRVVWESGAAQAAPVERSE